MTDPITLEALRTLLDHNRAEITAQYDAVGTGIGKEGDHHVIVVYLSSQDQHPREMATFEGVPLKFVVTGPFRTQN